MSIGPGSTSAFTNVIVAIEQHVDWVADCIAHLDARGLATVEATEEAIVNALVAAESMTGANDRYVMALPHDRLIGLLKKYNRLGPKTR